MNPLTDNRRHITRRALFGKTATGVGAAALAYLFNNDLLSAATNVPTTGPSPIAGALSGFPNFPPTAKRVIYMFQNGAPSHVDLFDYKPMLKKMHGKEIPKDIIGDKRFSTMTGNQKSKPVLSEITKFAQHGGSGAWVSDFLPQTASIADELCFIKSMHTGAVNHAPGHRVLPDRRRTARPAEHGRVADVRPRFHERKPARLRRHDVARQGSFLRPDLLRLLLGQRLSPVALSGREVPWQRRSSAVPLESRGYERGRPPRHPRRHRADQRAQAEEIGDPEISTRISQYEMAYKMQTSVPELTDLSKEPLSVLEMYGPGREEAGQLRLQLHHGPPADERGVRFVQLMHAGWDQHRTLNTQLKVQCADTERPPPRS
jgi:hypothetical protein